jgi:hypothetical protein
MKVHLTLNTIHGTDSMLTKNQTFGRPVIKGLALILLFHLSCTSSRQKSKDEVSVPTYMQGTYEDDYGIQHEISDELWFQKPTLRYHIKEWNLEEQYLIAKNDSANLTDSNLWTRIDWVVLDNMEPYGWAFCISSYSKESAEEAKMVENINPETPRTGCNGYPFSRMKAIVD